MLASLSYLKQSWHYKVATTTVNSLLSLGINQKSKIDSLDLRRVQALQLGAMKHEEDHHKGSSAAYSFF